MGAARRIDQLTGDAHHPATGFPEASFQHVAHAEFAADPFDVDRLSLVGKVRIAGDHEQGIEA